MRKGKHLWRAIALGVVSFLSLLKAVRRNKANDRVENLKIFYDALKIYQDVSKTWLLKAVRTPLISVLNDAKLNFNFMDEDVSDLEKKESRMIKAQVRVKGIIEGLIANTTPKEFPDSLTSFFASFTDKGSFIPDKLLTKFEIDRVQVDPYGILM